MNKQLLKFNQLENLEVGQDKKTLYFKLMLSSVPDESNIVIEIPDYTEVNFLNVQFMKDSIDKIIFEKHKLEGKEERFVVYFYIGKINICRYYFTLDLIISYDKYGNLRINILEDWNEKCYSPVLLELEQKK